MINKKHKRRRLLLVGVIILFIGVIIMLFSRETILPQYINTTTTTDDNEVNIEYQTITPIEGEQFSITIPQYIKKIDDKNSAYYFSDDINITFIKENYTHEVSLYTSQSFLKTLDGDVTMMTFNYPTTSSRLASYRRNSKTHESIIVDFTIWDRKTIIHIYYEINSDLYNKYLPIIRNSIDSYVWKTDFCIQPNLRMAYNEYGNCDFAIPAGFTDKSTSNMYAFESTNGLVYTTLEIYDNVSYLDKISNIAYMEYAGREKASYSLNKFNASKTQIIAESTYKDKNSGSIIYMYQKIVATGKKQYYISYYVDERAMNNNILQLVTDAFNYFSLR